jgi:anti-sigma factor (TIGR02949 family)
MEHRGRIDDMNCAESETLLHALIDGELDAGHERDVEAHVAACPACADNLQAFRAMREAIAAANLKEPAPASLRSRIEASLPLHGVRAERARKPWAVWLLSLRSSWRSFFGGLALGTALSAAVAASLVIAVVRNDQQQETASEIVSAHLRSLQPGHLTDVETSDQHTVKPWFNGKLDVAPPVIDLTAQGFTLIGGRLDYINGEPEGAIIYRRRQHIINLFVARHAGAEHGAAKSETVRGFNIRHWTAEGLDFWAVSDISAGELDEFARKFTAALRRGPS